MVQWFRLCAFTAKGIGSNPGQGAKIPHTIRLKKKKKKKNDICMTYADIKQCCVKIIEFLSEKYMWQKYAQEIP